MTVFEKLCRQVAEKHNIPYDQAEKAIRYQFSTVVKAMEKGDDESVWLQYLGTWGVKPKRREHIDARYPSKRD